ncbi:hypothetical protein N0V84_003367 [Fusarium piperis]|uniref:Fucose-specific lectin n=1 Tax=Fusarium piperis TaxID=1435070 RepID=A0A9W9BS87_9HYPO|nr:hypothetical protein N0V84_003367 [Fusarium piperis]
MSGQVKTIVRVLRSAGSVTLGNGNLVLLGVENGRLIEKIYDGDDLKDQRKVADNVKDGSSAVYAVSEKNVFGLYISQDNHIRASEFDADSEEWDDADLSGLGDVTVHPDSHLAIAAVYESSLIFFQAADGVIKSINHDQESNNWTEAFPVPGGAAAGGTPISAFSTNKAVVVSFIGQDNKLHAHSRDFETGEWTDSALPSASWEGSVTSLVVSQDVDTGAYEAFALVGTTVDHVKKDGTRDALGSIQSGEFVPATKAEAGDVYGNNYGIIQNYWNQGGGGCGRGGGNYICGGCGRVGGNCVCGSGTYVCVLPPIVNPCRPCWY